MKKGHHPSGPMIVGMVGLAISAVFSTWILYRVDWEITIFTAFGDESTAISQYAEERLGDVFHRVGDGHDGKYYFVQANDPWVLHPAENAQILDRPLYRSQRMFYPVLASAGGLVQSQGVVWSLLVVNILAMGVGSFATAGIATKLGGSPWWGLAFALNLGLTSEVNVSGAGVVAAAAAFLAVYFVYEERTWSAIVMLTVAILTREVMLIVAVGCAVWNWRSDHRQIAARLLFVPAAAALLWALYLRFQMGWEAGTAQIQEIGPPLVGLAQAVTVWRGDLLDLSAGLLIVGILIAFTVRAIRAPSLLGYAFVGFAFLAIFLTEQVWASYYDITRAIAPVLTAFVVLTFAASNAQGIEPRIGTSSLEL